VAVAQPADRREQQKEPVPQDPPPQGVGLAVLALCAALAVAAVLIFGAVSIRDKTVNLPPLVTVRMAGSSPFFDDPAVQRRFRYDGIQIQQTSLGSRAVATQPHLATRYDVANTDSYDAGLYVQQVLTRKGVDAQVASPVSSPMVIITYPPIVALLKTLGLVRETDGSLIFNVSAYLRVVNAGLRWSDIPGNSTYRSANKILLWTTNPRFSNSGGMFAAIASSAQLGDNPVTSVHPSDPYLSVIRKCFTEQGNMPTHTPDLLNLFLTDGMDRYPMILDYENDYIHSKLTDQGYLPPGLELLYPNPTVIADKTFVSWTGVGQRMINLLRTDKALISLEERDGYRTSHDNVRFVRDMAAKGIIVPNLDRLPPGLQIAPLPTDSNLQALINAVANG
jgi:hypothetical protein